MLMFFFLFFIILFVFASISSSNLPSTKAILIQAVKYNAGLRSSVISQNVAQVVGPGCPPRQSITWNKEKFQVGMSQLIDASQFHNHLLGLRSNFRFPFD